MHVPALLNVPHWDARGGRQSSDLDFGEMLALHKKERANPNR